jgi:hypothetical protein
VISVAACPNDEWQQLTRTATAEQLFNGYLGARQSSAPSSSSSSPAASGSRSGRRVPPAGWLAGWLAGGEAVAAQDVEIAVLERGQPGDVLVPDLVAFGAELRDGSVDVSGRPEHRGVQD